MGDEKWLRMHIERINTKLDHLEVNVQKLVLKDAKIAGGIIVASAIITIAFQLIQLIYK